MLTVKTVLDALAGRDPGSSVTLTLTGDVVSHYVKFNLESCRDDPANPRDLTMVVSILDTTPVEEEDGVGGDYYGDDYDDDDDIDYDDDGIGDDDDNDGALEEDMKEGDGALPNNPAS